MQGFVVADLQTIAERAFREAAGTSFESATACVGFFDLVGSTALKFERGHRIGAEKSLEYVALASAICRSGSGEVMKSLGDGIMVLFHDPLDACRAAVSLKQACADHGIRSSAGLALGTLDIMSSSTSRDVVGATVDRAARLQGLAMPNQTLIDAGLMEAVRSQLAGERDVLVSPPLEVNAKGLTAMSVYELSLRRLGLTRAVVTPFEIYAEGRMSIQDKTRFARQAKAHIKEFGTGLTAFAHYFTGHRPAEFKDHIRDLLERGVQLNCYGLAPESPWVEFVKQTSGPDYVEAAARARAAIIHERNSFIAQGLPGELRYFEYDHVPEFHGFCLDPEDPLRAQILISFYLPGMARAEAPVYQVASAAHPELFAKYLAAMRAIEDTARQVDR